MTYGEVRDYLKTVVDCPFWYAGKRDGSKNKSITVYPTPGPAAHCAIGRESTYGTKAVSILVHWGDTITEAEDKAQEVYDSLARGRAIIGNRPVVMFDMRSAEPAVVGTDEKGIYQFVINTIIYFMKED